MPRYCPNCRAEFDDQALVCWGCRTRLVDRLAPEEPLELEESGESEEKRVWVDLRPVYFAPDEFSALAVQRVLAGAGIDSHVRSLQFPWADGLMRNIKGYWGQVLVLPEDFDHAHELVEEYLNSLDSEGSPDPAEG
jgi:hypothetical protein